VLRVREVFATLQGEGSQAGRPAVFVRFTGCNLWSGTPEGRATGRGGCAAWCDTDFATGTPYEPEALTDLVLGLCEGWGGRPMVVVTGGEPCLQLRRPEGEEFVRALLGGVAVAVETNGTVEADVLSAGLHVTVSPKALRAPGSDPLQHVLVRTGTDLKVVALQWSFDDLARMGDWGFAHRFIQPRDDGKPGDPMNVSEVRGLAERLGWRVGLQTHKFMGVP
jgi:7-carboxy-7-deazaguanine synthase